MILEIYLYKLDKKLNLLRQIKLIEQIELLQFPDEKNIMDIAV